MPASDMTLQMVLKLKDEASKELGKAGKAVGGLNKQALLIGGAAVAGIAAAGAALWDAAKAAGEEELGVIRLGETVKNTGADWNTAQTAIEDYLTAELKRVALDDGEGRDSLNKLTAATGDYKEAMALLPGVMDLARGANISMEQATMLVTKAIDGSVGGLGKYGIEVSKEATNTEILGAIQAKYAGQAEAYGNTFAGAQAKMDIALGNLKETVGAAVLPVLTDLITKFANIAMDAMPAIETALNTVGPVFTTIFNGIGTVITGAWDLISPVFTAIVGWLQGDGTSTLNSWGTTMDTVMNGVKTTVETILGGLKTFWETNGDQIVTVVNTVWGLIGTAIDTAWGVIKGAIDTAMALFHGDWQGVWDGIKGIVDTIWSGIKTAFDQAWPLIKGAIDAAMTALKGAWDTAWNGIKTSMETIWTNIKTSVETKVGEVKTAIGTKLEEVKTVLSTAWNSIWEKAKTDWGTIASAVTGPINGLVGTLTTAADNIWKALFGPEGAFTKMRDKLSHIFEGVHIPLPHFTAKYTKVLGIDIVSGFDVQWYGKGLTNGVFNKPTLIGVGERGPEAVNVTPLGGGRSRGGGGMTLVFNYQPMMSMADEREAYTKLAPVLREVIVREQRRGVTW